MNFARMGFIGAEVDKGRQQSERANHQRTEGLGAFRQQGKRVRPDLGIHDRATDPQFGPKVRKTRMSRLRYEQEIHLFRGQVDVTFIFNLSPEFNCKISFLTINFSAQPFILKGCSKLSSINLK